MAGTSFRAALVDEVRSLNDQHLSAGSYKKPSGSILLRRAIASHLEANGGQITLRDLIRLLDDKSRGSDDAGMSSPLIDESAAAADMDEAEMDACMVAVIAWADALDSGPVAAPLARARFGEADDEDLDEDDEEAAPSKNRMPVRMGTLARAARHRAKS